MTKRKIHIHDFAGHPFQAELSNALANKGFNVLHSYFKHLGADKALFIDTSKTGNISFTPIVFEGGYENRNLIRRLFFELRLAKAIDILNRKFKPDFVICANAPLITAVILRIMTRRPKFILWHQDVISSAFLLLKRRSKASMTLLDEIQFGLLRRFERYLVSSSDGVICIAKDFTAIYNDWGLNLKNVLVIENWAPLAQISYIPKVEKINSVFDLLYAGTLGLKHNPVLLIELMNQLELYSTKCRLTVISQGEGADFLRSELDGELPIKIRDFVPLVELNVLLSNSDIALVLLEAEAANFSVPSKTYSYIAAGKFVIAFMPEGNSAVQAIRNAGGMVFRPTSEGVRQAAVEISKLKQEDINRTSFLAQSYALENFDIRKKVNLFLQVIQKSSSG